MSYLYSTFAQLVSVHCKAIAATSTVPVNQCKRNLLTYGYEKLQTFTNEELDTYDPYQRGASELIWSSIMREHPSSTLITTRKPIAIPMPPATSIIILTHQKPVKPEATSNDKDESTNIETASPQQQPQQHTDSQQYPENPIFEKDIDNAHKYAMDMDISYGYPGRPDYSPAQVEVFDAAQDQQDHRNTEQKKEQTFLTGPLVVRVRPDGTPVDDTLPINDDDLEAFHVNTAVVLPPTEAPTSQIVHAAAGRPTKHRKIATISALKQQYLTNLAVQQQLQPPIAEPVQELQPPLEHSRSRPRPRARRQHPEMSPALTGLYYSA